MFSLSKDQSWTPVSSSFPFISMALAAMLLFSGCLTAFQEEQVKKREHYIVDAQNGPTTSQAETVGQETDKEDSGAKPEDILEDEVDKARKLASFSGGKDKIGKGYNYPKIKKMDYDSDKKIQLNIKDMPISEYLNFFFGEVLGVTYSIDKGVESMKQVVNINMQDGMTVEKLYRITERILSMNQISMYEEDGVYFLRKGKSDGTPVLVFSNQALSQDVAPKAVTQVIPVEYIGEKVNEIKNLMLKINKSLRVEIEVPSDMGVIIVSGAASSVSEVVKMISAFDRPFLMENHVALMHTIYWDANALIEKVTELLYNDGIPVSETAGKARVRFVALEKFGSIICFAPNNAWIDRVAFWIETLDKPEQGTQKKQFYTYSPRFAKAEKLAEILTALSTSSTEGGGEETSGTTAQKSSTLKGEQLSVLGNKKAQGQSKSAAQVSSTASTPAAQLPKTSEDIQSFNFKSYVDEDRNVLVMFCTRLEYQAAKRLFEQIDTMPRMVSLEVMVAEITLDNSLQFGVEWYLEHSDGFQGILSTLGDLGIGSGGMTYSIVNSSGTFEALINALDQNTDVTIVSRPKIVVQDNKSATLNVGTEVPIITTETSSDVTDDGTTSVDRSVEYRSTGAILTIKPQIKSGGLVELEIKQELSEAQTNSTSDINSPLILNRSLSTTILCSSNQSVFFGGILSDQTSKTTTKVPLLGDIPGLGWLFKTQSSKLEKTELIMLITPKIVNDFNDLSEVREKVFNDISLFEINLE